jgi:DNA-binding NarL/FixJ family response regulator
MRLDNNQYKEVTVIVVDDDDVDAMSVERALVKFKILNPVIRARDGIEALSLLRHPTAVNRPYIVLLDINMPRMNGLEMLQELRIDQDLSRAVVFMLTTSKSDEDIVAAYDQHIAGYIVKNDAGTGFLKMIEMLDHYWRVVELPIKA